MIRYSRNSISGPLTSHGLLHLIQQQPKTLTSNCAKNANVLKAGFSPAQPARSKACTFFVSQRHGFPARQMNEIVSPVTVYQDQTARTDCGRHEKNCRKQRLDSASQCNSSAVSDLIAAEIHLCNRHIGLVVFASERRVPNTQSGSFLKKKHAHADREREQGVVTMGPGTLDPEPVMSRWRKRNPMHGARTSKERSPQ